MELKAPDEESMVRVAVAHLGDRFGLVERSRIEDTVRRVVHEWYARSRVKTFVGIFAERHAGAALQQRPESRASS
jgi:hypothetical protein